MHNNLTLASGWISTGAAIGTDIKWLIFAIAIPVLCGLFVVVVGWKTKAPGPTIMAVIFAAIVWGLAANMSALKDKTTEDITHYEKAPTTIQGDL